MISLKRVGNLFEKLISDENLFRAIHEVNRSHHWRTHHRPNRTTAWVEETAHERVEELRRIILDGFEQREPKVTRRYDASARKWRTVSEPIQWPDQYVHHALVQVISPVIMRGMDPYCCGSVKGRGPHYARKAIERWMRRDKKGTKYGGVGDVYHFYESLKPEVVMACMRRLIKDARVLDLIWRVVKGGILIGAYTSQWFANAVLQPLDHLIRKSGAAHYVRYMDNLTLFGANKRKLRRLFGEISVWLEAHGLRLKGDWQIYPTSARMPDAVGYRYGRDYTLPRKHNLLRIKRAVNRFRRRKRCGQRVLPGHAASLISRLGQLRHCNNRNIYRMVFRGERILRQLKDIIRSEQRKERLTWSMYLAQRAMSKRSRQRAQLTAT